MFCVGKLRVVAPGSYYIIDYYGNDMLIGCVFLINIIFNCVSICALFGARMHLVHSTDQKTPCGCLSEIWNYAT
eukprot:m.199884 g.199884  ORF g.199884 m.199884 type:complete len:74 (+) comp15732_c0_seq7:142-363(+)